jgi:hypothetical protein
MNAQRYLVTVTYERVARDGSGSEGTRTRSGTLWATSPDDAKARMEHWAELEFRRPGFTVIAHATDAQLAH